MYRSDPFAPPLDLQLFGGANLKIDGKPPDKRPPKKVFAVLSRLALAPANEYGRVSLANEIWPEVETESRRLFYLRRTLTATRDAIKQHADLLTQPSRDLLKLNLDQSNVDAITFDQAIASQDAARVDAALRLYSGPLLAGYTEPWALHEREKRKSSLLRGIALLRASARSDNDVEKLVLLSRMAVKIDPTSESELRELIMALAESGDPDGACRVYTSYARQLRRHAEHMPESETRSLYAQISSGTFRRIFSALTEHQRRIAPGDYLRPLTAIVGRSHDTDKLSEMMRANRLVTITAAGGFGKTRLAHHLASMLSAEFPGGVWFTDLAPITDPRLVASTIMKLLRLKEQAGISVLQAIKARLQALPALIILDNCEHLRDACGRVAQNLLTGASPLHILATSRQSLGVTGEAIYRLGPLETPSEACAPNEDLDIWKENNPAVSLFVQRAEALGVFKLTQQNAGSVARICARLEGNALALELAAVQTRIYRVEELASRLDQLFDLLVADNPSVQPRQRTLRALIGWSFDLLPEPEATLLSRLSVFRGSWTLNAAEAICSHGDLDPRSIPTLVANLTDKSMVQTVTTGSGSMRFRLLDMIRKYTLDLTSSKSVRPKRLMDKLNRRFTGYYANIALDLKQRIMTNEQPAALRMMEQEEDNLHLALELSVNSRDIVTALGIANSMWRYWDVRGHYSEGISWFSRALATGLTPDLPLLCESLLHAGNIAYNAARLREARDYYQRYLDAELERGLPVFIASGRASIAIVLEAEGAYRKALNLLKDAVEVLQQHDKTYLAAVCHSNIGNNYVGIGEYEHALDHYRQALSVFAAYRNTSDFTHASVSYANTLALSGEPDSAASALQDVIESIIALESADNLSRALLIMARLTVNKSQFDNTATLLGLYEAFIEARRLTPFPGARVDFNNCMAAARTSLRSEFSRHFDIGYSMPYSNLLPYLQKLVNIFVGVTSSVELN